MITILKSDTVSTLSKVLGSPFALAGNNDFPRVEVLTSGEFIEEAINGWLEKYTQIRISDKVIMPDHIHICVDVHEFFEGRFSPQGLEFDLMMQARLLLVYPMAYENESKAISYGKAQEMNRIAARIAGTDWYGNNVRIRKC